MPTFATPKLILCVDDDHDDCEWIKEAINEADDTVQVITNHNGQQALNTLNHLSQHNQLPRLILLDINMPVMDGKQTLSAIKTDPRFRHIPVVMLTTSSSATDQLFCSRHGVKMVTKPSVLLELKATVRQLLSQCA